MDKDHRYLLLERCVELAVPIQGGLDERASKCYEALFPGPEPVASSELRKALAEHALMFRFFNNDSWFTEADLELLGQKLAHVPVTQREYFYHATLALRRRTTSEDASVVELFRDPETGALVRPEDLSTRVVNMLGLATPPASPPASGRVS